MKRYAFTILLVGLVAVLKPALGQDPKRFEKEVASITAASPTDTEDIVLFTGSSTIRMWKDIQTYFPSYNILNRGFGGSQTSDLLYYADELIVNYHPVKVFIYEGDNDLGAGKSTEVILRDSRELVKHLREKLGAQLPIIFITPKPSKARWHLKENYLTYIDALKQWAKTEPHVSVADLWTPMLASDGVVMQDIFLEDGLHMNKKGYDIWGKALAPFVK